MGAPAGPTSHTTVVEASSGSTAVSEASFARRIGVPFVAVMRRSTSPEKVTPIERQGGRCRFVEHGAQVFLSEVIDLMLPVPDAAGIAAARRLHERTWRFAGGSTGTNPSGSPRWSRGCSPRAGAATSSR
ncbi:pyridoxal-phosphate dependent enzyme [Pseudonocardia sp. RS010]|uniref:pyridoxal-phosphate dependent enzyme n=1 Tax=Pseudonocardia sp. RS010 TaxID=3385979 RepID=UPI0039A19490